MKENAIQLVSKAFAGRLENALKVKVFVGSPDDNPDDASIIIFPYRLAVNQALRNAERTLPPASTDPHGELTIYQDSIPLDVFYLLTIGKAAPDAAAKLEPQYWLGGAIQELQRDPNLVGEAVDGDTVRLSLEPAGTDELSHIWALFPNTNYRTSVVYLASPVWIDPVSSTRAARVVDDRRDVGQKAA